MLICTFPIIQTFVTMYKHQVSHRTDSISSVSRLSRGTGPRFFKSPSFPALEWFSTDNKRTTGESHWGYDVCQPATPFPCSRYLHLHPEYPQTFVTQVARRAQDDCRKRLLQWSVDVQGDDQSVHLVNMVRHRMEDLSLGFLDETCFHRRFSKIKEGVLPFRFLTYRKLGPLIPGGISVSLPRGL